MMKHSLVLHEMTPGIDYVESYRLIRDKVKSRARKFWKSLFCDVRVPRNAVTMRDFTRYEIFVRLINALTRYTTFTFSIAYIIVTQIRLIVRNAKFLPSLITDTRNKRVTHQFSSDLILKLQLEY